MPIVAAISSDALIDNDGHCQSTVHGRGERRYHFFDNAFSIVASGDPVTDHEQFFLGQAKEFTHHFTSRSQERSLYVWARPHNLCRGDVPPKRCHRCDAGFQ
jgi:hypothetical protein